MKKLLLVMLMVALVAPLFARDIEPVVSTGWLADNLGNSKLVVVDVRKVEDYKAGHIPGAISMLASIFYGPRDGLSNQLPFMDDLSDELSDAGIASDSLVVVVEADNSRLHFAARVAWTLAYVGLDNVAILNGGQAAWAKDGKTVSTDAAKRKGSDFTVKEQKAYLALKADVLGTKGQLVDNRGYDAYFGLTKAGIVAQFGHIPGAYALPGAWIVDANGMIKSKEDLSKIATGLGLDPAKETIVYCDSGVACASWWWIFNECLGWPSVRLYDGSSHELAADPAVKYTTLTWR
jgi:thiosulfate/3-mercaptopyruvate sulfurtransferase